MSISWPIRSKTATLIGLSSAQSVTITVTSSVNSAVATLSSDRPTDPAAATIGYTLPTKLPVGPCALAVTLYSQTKEGGIAVGSINTDCYVGGTGVLYGADNNPISSLQVTGVVASVQITVPNTTGAQTAASVTVGSTLQLGFTVEDADHNLLAVSSSSDQGAGYFAVQSSATATCTPTGLVTGVAAGKTIIACSVDGQSAQLTLTVNAAPIAPQITVGWGALTKAVPLTSARSVAVSITDGTNTSTVKADRLSFAANPASYTQTLTGGSTLNVGSVTITVTFYDETGEQGDVVGTFNGTGTMTSTGTLDNQSGSSLGTVDSNAVITRVVINTPTAVAVGSTEQLTFSCYDANNNKVANVAAGSGSFSTSGSDLTVSPAGIVTGVAAGSQNVTCTVDGVTSQSVSVTVNAGPTSPVVYIGFGAITRASGLTSARSVQVVVTDSNGLQSTAIADRQGYSVNNGVAYAQLMSFDQGIAVGSVKVTCTFYDETGEQGDVVGRFSNTTATMTNAGILDDQGGTAFGNSSSNPIYGNAVITTVVITGQPISVTAGSPKQLNFACYDTNNNLIANVDPGSATWTSSGSVLTITPSGIVTGNTASSSQNVTCTVDGVSATASVKVN